MTESWITRIRRTLTRGLLDAFGRGVIDREPTGSSRGGSSSLAVSSQERQSQSALPQSEKRLKIATRNLQAINQRLIRTVHTSQSQVSASVEEDVLSTLQSLQTILRHQFDSLSKMSQTFMNILGAQGADQTKNAVPVNTELCSTHLYHLVDVIDDLLGVLNNVRDMAVKVSSTSTNFLTIVERDHRGIQQMTEDVNETVEIVKEMVESVDSGRVIVNQNVKGMDKIRQSVMEATDIVKKMGKRSQDIGSMAKIIRDVAERTNLLALNAGIIAAQAGEQGRSFAVVAEEIKALAERTTSSAKDITLTVGRIQKETTYAIHSMEMGVGRVEEGVDLTWKVGEALEKISQCAKMVRNKVDHVNVSIEMKDEENTKTVSLIQEVQEALKSVDLALKSQNKRKVDVTRLVKNLKSSMEETKSRIEEDVGRWSLQIDSLRNPAQSLDQVSQSLEVSCDLIDKVIQDLGGALHEGGDTSPMVSTVMADLRAFAEQVKLLETVLIEHGMMEKEQHAVSTQM